MLRIVPGVQYQADPDSAGGTFGTGSPGVLGTSSGVNHIAVDGVTSNDQGSPNVFSSVTTLDAIDEVKVLLNSYQAEYAGNGGAVIQVVTKSGGHEYHGSLYEFFRNEDLNANNFFNNRTGVPAGKVSLQHTRRNHRWPHLHSRPLEHEKEQAIRLLQHRYPENRFAGCADELHHADATRAHGRFLPDCT